MNWLQPDSNHSHFKHSIAEWIQKNGHPYYQFWNIDDPDTYEQRWKEEDKSGHSLLFSENENNIDEKETDGEHIESEEDEGDPIIKHMIQ